MNKVYLIGRVTHDIEVKNVSGKSVTRFTLAVEREYSQADKEKRKSEGKQTVDFIYCTVWGNLAESISKYVGKGNKLAVEGRLQINRVTKNNENKIYPEVYIHTAEFIEFKNEKQETKLEVKESFEETNEEYDYSNDFEYEEDYREDYYM